MKGYQDTAGAWGGASVWTPKQRETYLSAFCIFALKLIIIHYY